MHEAFIIVAAILFFLDFILWWVPTPQPWGGRLSALGLFFFAISFSALVGAH